MVNRNLLNEKIKQSGLKKSYLAESIGVSRSTFCALLNNKSEFRVSQIQILCALLGIRDDETLRAIFFAQNGALKATTTEQSRS